MTTHVFTGDDGPPIQTPHCGVERKESMLSLKESCVSEHCKAPPRGSSRFECGGTLAMENRAYLVAFGRWRKRSTDSVTVIIALSSVSLSLFSRSFAPAVCKFRLLVSAFISLKRPGLLETRADVRFALKCQAFIELVKKGEPTAAVALAQVSSCADGAQRALDVGHVVETTMLATFSARRKAVLALFFISSGEIWC